MNEAASPQDRGERWTVDAVEDTPGGAVARLEREDGRTFTLPLRALPPGVREGDVLAVEDGPDGATTRVLPEETRARRAAARARLYALNTEGAGGPFTPDDEGEITL
ncbi:DUF3006 domain-containing protein [Deinococcus navajonensis]|uniref:DUF3006 domain-containing protein n=1 Tax=Deinococcus navajonensis TaxID=309884 RepID=A0ABV8XLZ9_9DEIO